MNKPIEDEKHRERALDPRQSFIVQAPAGSGKTELLTQRFLVLLSTVKQPEEILAITFTKKSAAEMRMRIIQALNMGCDTLEPETAHAQKTWRLAKKVLAQNKQLNWDLLNNPNRLRIQTIDSFNTFLTRQLPILSHFGASPEICDNAEPLYREAIQEFLTHLEEKTDWSDAIARLLMHFDNDLEKVENLLISMLQKRDQWLPYITLNAGDPLLRLNLEANLAEIIRESLLNLLEHFPPDKIAELVFLADYAAKNCRLEKPDSAITHCADLQGLPKSKEPWLGLAELLFTKELTWRKDINKNQGFPTATTAAEKGYYKEMKQRMQALLEQLCGNQELQAAFVELINAPEPFYQQKQWEVLEALHQALRVAVAQLKLIFQQHGKIDYIENAQAALAAMGTDDAPTDITLALDYQIRHILVDEFQDTSNTQYRLLEKLTHGWERGDGRTLFVVGDPMQSIYRFREAEVGLFIRARKKSIGYIQLEPLTLSVNFRSTVDIVNWVNEHFAKVLPPFEDIATGAVSYSPSTAIKTASSSTPAVSLHAFGEDEPKATQAQEITQLIQEIKQQHPQETIAILVRSRNQLEHIIPALKNAHIAYRAIDIDALNKRPLIQDLLALTQALMHPADRVSWLAVLRAPWCGLSLSDLLILTGPNTQLCLWERLNSTEVMQQLSAAGQQSLARVWPVLQEKANERCRYPLRLWIETTWLALGGPACVTRENDLADASVFFHLLERLDKGGQLPHLEELHSYLENLRAAADNEADDTLQIMTIYSAKGLEFDHVILPHLESGTGRDDNELLSWIERPQQDDTSALIMAPLHATEDENDSIYEYIKKQRAVKTKYENGRLLYVAATRAKKQLRLFFNAKPNPNSLLEKLWPAIAGDCHPEHNKRSPNRQEIQPDKRTLHRLTLDWRNPLRAIQNVPLAYNVNPAGFVLTDNTAKYSGIVIHRILQQMANVGVAWWQEKSVISKRNYLTQQLLQLGMISTQLDTAIKTIVSAIDNTLGDARGQWLLTAHTDAQTEYPLTAVINGEVRSLIIDRTFVDESGVRWIIDYKNALFSGKNVEQFLAGEQEKYAEQLQHYAIAMQQLDARPIRLGLYFPLLPAWREWDMEKLVISAD